MKILQIIHYPPRYSAGSEVYTQTLAHGLAARHEVHVTVDAPREVRLASARVEIP